MAKSLDWKEERDMWLRMLIKQTGEGLDYWNPRVSAENPADENQLRAWLQAQGISGYAENLLVRERFGYADWMIASADELIDGQYADREHLRPIYNAILNEVAKLGDFTIQSRKTYVSLVTSRRTFARIKPSTQKRVDVGLRLADQEPAGRLKPCKMQATMKVQLELTSVDELDNEALNLIQQAYLENN